MLPFPIISNTEIPDRPTIQGTGVLYDSSSSIAYGVGSRGVLRGNTIYFFPGHHYSSYAVLSGFFAFNIDTGVLTTLTSPPVLLGLSWYSMVGDYIYTGGGRVTNSSTGAWNNTIYRYSIIDNIWETVTTYALNAPYSNGTTIGSKIYSSRGNGNYIDIFDTSTNTMSSISRPFNSAGISATSQYTYITSNETDTLYVVSTINPTTTPVGYCYSYNINNSTWTNITKPEMRRTAQPVYNKDDGFVYYFSIPIENTLIAFKNTNYVVRTLSSPSASRISYHCGVYYKNAIYMLSIDSTAKMIKFT